MMTEDSQPIVIEVTVGAPIEKVWETLRDPELIKRWHGWHADELEQEIDEIFVQHTQSDDAAHTLQLGDGDRFELTVAGDGTVVRVVRAPYDPDSEWGQYYNEITEGWLSFVNQLKFLHERHPGEARRTLFFSGTGPAGALAALLEEVPSDVGEPLYTAEHQRGLLLPKLGPGLLILAAKPPGDAADSGAVDAMAIVTVYGLDDERFGTEVADWTAWWRSRYPDAAPAQV